MDAYEQICEYKLTQAIATEKVFRELFFTIQRI